MARKQGKAGESASADIVWTNISKNPVILSDGSSVGAGEKTTPEQAEFAEGSFWEEHGVLVSGAPLLIDEGSDQIEALRDQLVAAGSEKAGLETEVSRLKADLEGEMTAARGFQVEHEELKSELEGLKAENEQLKVDGESSAAQLAESEAKVKALQAEVESLKKPAK